MTPDPIPYVPQLRSQLVNGVARERARRKRRRRHVFAGAVVAALAAALVLGIATLDEGDRSTALAVTRDDRWITVEIADATAEPRRMTQELRDAGINGEVKVRPVSPSLVGRWAALEARPATPTPGREQIVSITELVDEPPGPTGGPGLPPIERRLFSIDFDRDKLRIPVDFKDRVVLTAGRAPQGEELYAESASAFAPKEPLHCTGIERLPPAQAERAIAARGYKVHTAFQPDFRLPPDRQRRGKAKAVVSAQLVPTRPTAHGVGRPRSRNEIVLFVSSSASAPTPHGIPPQDCGP